jgi:hypothetical protein
MSPQDTDTFPAARPPAAFDPLTALDDLVSTVRAARAAAGSAVSIAGQDPILAGAHRMRSFVGRCASARDAHWTFGRWAQLPLRPATGSPNQIPAGTPCLVHNNGHRTGAWTGRTPRVQRSPLRARRPVRERSVIIRV